jgi:glycolate oxidase FAD binding subunit
MGTKPRLGEVSDLFTRFSTLRLRGIVEYEPDEYTVTALSGTSLLELAAALGERGQYLPFDPLFLEAGATLGGTVAAGTNGPGRFRFGGVRDFILGVRFVDGGGRLLRVGGKVVKNAAGFDLPKFFVGSLGRFGMLADVSLKVFPRPAEALTLRLQADCPDRAAQILTEAANSRWEVDALDLPPVGNVVDLRLAGPAPALATLSREILARWPGELVPAAEAKARWTALRECLWAHPDGVLIKVAITVEAVSAVIGWMRSFEGGRLHISSGGNVAFLSLAAVQQVPGLDEKLRAGGLAAITLRGRAPLWLGVRRSSQLALAVKEALDSQHRFPSLED